MEIKTIVLSVIALRNLLIEIQQEISQVQKYGAGAAKHANDKFSEIITGYDKFLDDLKTGFLAEVQSTGVTPHQFIVKYGICDYTKDGGGISGINVENFSFKKQKELFVGKRKGEIIRSFGSLQIAIFKSVQSKQKVLKFQFPWPK